MMGTVLVPDEVEGPPLKRVKLEESVSDEGLFLHPPLSTPSTSNLGGSSTIRDADGPQKRPKKVRVRNPEERKRIISTDPRVRDVEPHHAFCLSCNSRVKLHNSREYDMYSWNKHIDKCEKRDGAATAQATVASSSGNGVNFGAEAATPKEVVVIDEEGSMPPPATVPSPVLALSPPTQADALPPKFYLKLNPGSLKGKATEPPSVVKTEELPMDTDPVYSYTPSLKRKKGRTVQERIDDFKKDPRCGEVQAHQVFCLVCKKWIQLYRGTEYIDSNWLRHAERHTVDGKPNPNQERMRTVPSAGRKRAKAVKTEPVDSVTVPVRSTRVTGDAKSVSAVKPKRGRPRASTTIVKAAPPITPMASAVPAVTPAVPSVVPDIPPVGAIIPPVVPVIPSAAPASLAAPQISNPLIVPKLEYVSAPPRWLDSRTTEERRQELEADDRCEQVEVHRVFCRLCQNYIGLHAKKDYSTANWYKHVQSCGAKAANKRKRKPPAPVVTAPPPPKAPKTIKIPKIEKDLFTFTPLSHPSSATPSVPPAVDKGLSAPVIDEASTPQVQNATIPSVPERPDYTSVFQAPLLPSLADTPYAPVLPSQVAFPPAAPSVSSTPAIVPSLPVITSQVAVIEVVDDELVESSASRLRSAENLQRGVEERRAKFLEDDTVAEVEPHRVKCKLCQRWYKLANDVEYAAFNWFKHIQRCKARVPKLENPSEIPSVSASPQVVVKAEPMSEELFMRPYAGKRSTAAERYARMQQDTRIKSLDPHKVECGYCGKWIKLQNKTEYDFHNWLTHIAKCQLRAIDALEVPERKPEVLAPPKVHTSVSERVENLRNDLRVATAEPHRILCNLCQNWIKLRDDQQYALTNWHKHVSICDKSSAPSKPSISVKKEAQEGQLSVKIRRTKAEREAELRGDPRLDKVEPGRVHCQMCNSWIRLNDATGYLGSNWQRHAERCQPKHGWQGSYDPTTVTITTTTSTGVVKKPAKVAPNPILTTAEVVDLDEEDNDGVFGSVELAHLVEAFEPQVSSTDFFAQEDGINFAGPSTFSLLTSASRMGNIRPDKRKEKRGPGGRRSAEMRKAELEADPRTKVVKPDRIQCAMCNRWVAMRQDSPYSGQNWERHAGPCEKRTGWRNPAGSGKKGASPAVIDLTEGNAEKPGTPAAPEPTYSHVVEDEEEEWDLPYNARLAALEEKRLAQFGNGKAPSFKPVDWSTTFNHDEDVLESESESEDELEIEEDDVEVQMDVEGGAVLHPTPVASGSRTEYTVYGEMDIVGEASTINAQMPENAANDGDFDEDMSISDDDEQQPMTPNESVEGGGLGTMAMESIKGALSQRQLEKRPEAFSSLPTPPATSANGPSSSSSNMDVDSLPSAHSSSSSTSTSNASPTPVQSQTLAIAAEAATASWRKSEPPPPLTMMGSTFGSPYTTMAFSDNRVLNDATLAS